MKNIITAICLLAIAFGSIAAEVSGINVDDKATVGGQELVLNGAGMRTRLFIKVYVAALYVPQKTCSIQGVIGRERSGVLRGVSQRLEHVTEVIVYGRHQGERLCGGLRVCHRDPAYEADRVRIKEHQPRRLRPQRVNQKRIRRLTRVLVDDGSPAT